MGLHCRVDSLGWWLRLVLLGVLLATTPIQTHAAESNSPKKTSVWKKCRTALLASALLVAPLAAAPSVYHTVNAEGHGSEHIGRGIYLDLDEFRAALSTEHRAILDNSGNNPMATVYLLNRLLEGDAGDWGLNVFPEARSAAEFLKGRSQNRGVCRHKAGILAAVLQRVGIDAELESGFSDDPLNWHVWVYLPEFELVADPMAGVVRPASTYHADYKVILPGVPMAPGWY